MNDYTLSMTIHKFKVAREIRKSQREKIHYRRLASRKLIKRVASSRTGRQASRKGLERDGRENNNNTSLWEAIEERDGQP